MNLAVADKRHSKVYFGFPKLLICLVEAAAVLLLVYLGVAFKNLVLDKRYPVYVFVLSYPRSGSTFLGDLLAADKHSVFLFEPDLVLQDLKNSSKHVNPLLYLENKPFCSEVAAKLNLNCSDPKAANAIFISSIIHSADDRSLQILLRHKASIIRHRSANTHILRPVRDLAKAKQLLLKSRYIIVKTIRLSILDIQPLIEIFERIYHTPLHVVHLVRDPRARALSLKSQLRKWPKKSRDPHRYCTAARRDLINGPILIKGRYHLIRYEDLVFNPVQEAKMLYGTLGMKWNKDIKQHVEDLVYKELLDFQPDYAMSSYFSTFRESYISPERWRWMLPRNDIAKIDLVCAELMTTLGYNPYSDQDDLSHSLVMVVSSSPSQSLLLSDMITQHPDAALFFQPDEILPEEYNYPNNPMDLLKCNARAIEKVLKRQAELSFGGSSFHESTIRKLGRTGKPYVKGQWHELQAMCLASKFRVLALRPSTFDHMMDGVDASLRTIHVIPAMTSDEWKRPVQKWPHKVKDCAAEDNWRKQKCKVVSQEDFKHDPCGTARHLYEWLQIPWPGRKMEAFFEDQALGEHQEE